MLDLINCLYTTCNLFLPHIKYNQFRNSNGILYTITFNLSLLQEFGVDDTAAKQINTTVTPLSSIAAPILMIVSSCLVNILHVRQRELY